MENNARLIREYNATATQLDNLLASGLSEASPLAYYLQGLLGGLRVAMYGIPSGEIIGDAIDTIPESETTFLIVGATVGASLASLN